MLIGLLSEKIIQPSLIKVPQQVYNLEKPTIIYSCFGCYRIVSSACGEPAGSSLSHARPTPFSVGAPDENV